MDDDADDDVDGIGSPLPPDDRLWRHPSELSSLAGRRPIAPLSGTSTTARGPGWPVLLVAGLVGAALSGGLLAVTGTLSTGGRERVVEKVAVSPVVSSPMLQGERGVAALSQQVGPAIVRLVVRTADATSQASGVVFRDDGLLLTSAHDVVGAVAISVRLHDGRRVDGELVGIDLPTDVAVVSIDAGRLTVAVLGTSADLEVGSTTIAVGAAREAGARPSVTTGVVSATERRVDVDGAALHGMIQTDAPIEAAWSGGPLLDAAGAVIGITTDVADDAAFGFATPIDLVRRIADELVAAGKVTHGWLGIEGADLTAAQVERMGVAEGAMVRDVTGGSPAERSGLAPNDVITDVGGQPVASSSGLVVAMRHHKPGDRVAVGYWRDGARHETMVTIDPHP
jgi:putative serine protease PepD